MNALKVLGYLSVCLAGVVVTVIVLWSVGVLRQPSPASAEDRHAHAGDAARVRLSLQARSNLGLVVEAVQLDSYWLTIPVPGLVVERPGYSDRGVTAPLTGVVTRIAAVPGDTVKPGDELFTLHLVSEYLQNSQAQLYKTARDLEINREEQERLSADPKVEQLSRARLLELRYEERRLRAAWDAAWHDLSARGLKRGQIEEVATGKFVIETKVLVPEAASPVVYEVEELKVHLGEQVQAGQTLCRLANHESLYVEGQAFEQDIARLQGAARQGWPVRAELYPASERPATKNQAAETVELKIRHVANHVDPRSRTVAFYLPLVNEVEERKDKSGETFRAWRFRPGQRMRLHVRVEKLQNVFVVPADAVVREGAEAYVFRANGDVFDRKPVVVLHEDGTNAVLDAKKSGITAGNVIAHNAAAGLNRALKAKAAEAAGDDHHGHSHPH